MSERKVLNKYYPPDYDPSKIPKLKRAKDRQYVIRVMAPFNLRCKTCGNYIYKGTKFNARMETVQEENYIGLRIYRFYIKCTKCVAEITFKTDPENMDYAIEHGATRNFEAEKILDQQEKQLQAQKEADESNPMKMLEIRTRDSKREMELLEKLEELKDLNERHLGVDYDEMLRRRQETEEERITREKAEEDAEIRKIFDNGLIRRLQDEDSDEDSPATSSSSTSSASKRSLPPPSEILTINETSSSAAPPASKTQKLESKKRAIASLGIVRKQKKVEPKNDAESEVSNTVTAKPEVHQTSTPSNAKEPAKPSGLGLLGNYGSDSSGSSNDSDY